MQYVHGKDEWQQTNVINSLEDISSVNSNNYTTTTTTTATVANNMNGGTFEKADGGGEVVDHRRRGGGGGSATPPTDGESSGTFSMEASLSRIDALAESLSDITRKRVVGHQQQQGRVKKRPSIGSSCSVANTSMCSGSSLAIDELASIDSAFLSSIDGFSAVSSVDNLGIGRLSLGGGDDGASTTSARFSSGMWSVQDCEPWTCSICTFDNEPVFLSCEMCGQTRTASARVQTLNNHRRISSHHQQMSEEQERERTRIQQEQRMREFQQQEVPALREPSAADVAASASAAMEPLQIPTVIEAKRRKKTKAERDARRKREARERAEERRRNSGQIPSMETTLEETGESPSSSGSARSSRSGRRKSSSSSKSSRHKTAPPAPTTTTHIGSTSGAATVVTNATMTSASTISTMSTMSTLGTNTPSAAPIASNTAPVRPSSPMQDGSLQNVFEFSAAVIKPARKRDPLDESTATERTFDMDQSAMTNMGMSQSNMDASSSFVLGQSSRSWFNSGSRRSGGSNKYNKAYRQQQSWFEGMDEISDEISV